ALHGPPAARRPELPVHQVEEEPGLVGRAAIVVSSHPGRLARPAAEPGSLRYASRAKNLAARPGIRIALALDCLALRRRRVPRAGRPCRGGRFRGLLLATTRSAEGARPHE